MVWNDVMWCDVMCSKHPFCISRIMHLFAVRFSAEFVWRSPCMEKWWGLSYIIYEYHRTSLVLCYREFHLKMYDALVGFFVSLHSSYLWRADRVSLNFTKYFLTKAFSNNACVEQMWKMLTWTKTPTIRTGDKFVCDLNLYWALHVTWLGHGLNVSQYCVFATQFFATCVFLTWLSYQIIIICVDMIIECLKFNVSMLSKLTIEWL